MSTEAWSEDTPAWEMSKENVVPLKRGRSARGLGEALASVKSFSQESNYENEFEIQLKNSGNSSEMLEIYVKYFKWFRDNNPSDTEKSLKLLEVFYCSRVRAHSLPNYVRNVQLHSMVMKPQRTISDL
jgi:hypothetical protein